MALTVGSLTGRVIKQVRDKWGRWVCQEFQGRADRRVVIISAYQPVANTSTSPGKITVIAQQKSLIIKEHADAIHPRTAFEMIYPHAWSNTSRRRSIFYLSETLMKCWEQIRTV